MHTMKLVCGPALVLLSVACSGPTIVTTDDAAPAGTPTAAPALSTTRPSNAHLANAFHFAAQVNGATAYYFTTPSGRWQCAIMPREQAGCQNAKSPSSAIAVTGAPDEVPGPEGAPADPNAIVVDRAAEAQFAAQSPPPFGLDPGPATVLPFNRILAVAGFRCNVQEAAGISCKSEFSGKGFTFSAEGYTMTYTDVPADAP
jgi:hypothetical protein